MDAITEPQNRKSHITAPPGYKKKKKNASKYKKIMEFKYQN